MRSSIEGETSSSRTRIFSLLFLTLSGSLLVISSLLLAHLKAITASSQAQRVTRQGVAYEGPVSRYVRQCAEGGGDSDCRLEAVPVPTKMSFILMITWPAHLAVNEAGNITFTTLEVKEQFIGSPPLRANWVLLGTFTPLNFRFVPDNSLEISIEEGGTHSISITPNVIGRYPMRLEMTLFSKELEHDPNLYDKLLEFDIPQIQIDVSSEPSVLGITRIYLVGIQVFLVITTLLAVVLNILFLFLARRWVGKRAQGKTLPP